MFFAAWIPFTSHFNSDGDLNILAEEDRTQVSAARLDALLSGVAREDRVF
jgi:hypothetical protein